MLKTQILQLFTRLLKWKVYTKVIKMPSWMAWVQRPSCQIKVEGSTRAFIGALLDQSRECFVQLNIDY